MDLTSFFNQYNKAALAFSGGVDSAFLLYAGIKAGADIHAYYVKSQFQPQFELDDATRLAAELGAKMTIIELDVLAEPLISRNGPDRCYYCKKRIFSAIVTAAAADGYTVLLDGSNASDDSGDRPGMRAAAELSVLSPLRECGLTKADIRALSKEAGLFTWDKPAYACLATRTPTGTALTKEQLVRTEKAESFLSSLGLWDFRVRTVGESALLQIREDQFPLLISLRGEINSGLLNYYKTITLDLEARHES